MAVRVRARMLSAKSVCAALYGGSAPMLECSWKLSYCDAETRKGSATVGALNSPNRHFHLSWQAC
jgi:hypothetical protein